MHAVVRPPSVPDDSGIKKPDAGKGVAVLSPAIKSKTGDAEMASKKPKAPKAPKVAKIKSPAIAKPKAPKAAKPAKTEAAKAVAQPRTTVGTFTAAAEKKGGHFTKVGDDDYVGPSGKHFNYNQVRAYYSNGGSWDGMADTLETGEGTVSPAKIRMDWMPQGQYEQEQKGLKKAVAARKKADRQAKLKAVVRPAVPAAPFVPKVQLKQFDPGVGGGTDRDKIPPQDFAGKGRKFPIVSPKDVKDAARLVGHAPDPAAVKSKIKAIATRKGFPIPDSYKHGEHHVMVKSGGDPGVYYAKSSHGTLDEATAEAKKHKGAFVQKPDGTRHDVAAADATVSKANPPNPLNIKPPKGSAIAPAGPISVREKAVLRIAMGGDFDEDKHPRDAHGRFGSGGGIDQGHRGDQSRETAHIGGMPAHPEYIGSAANPALDAPGTVLGMPLLPGTASASLPGMSPSDYAKYSTMKAGGETFTGGAPAWNQQVEESLRGESHAGISKASTITISDGDKVYSGPDGSVHVFKQDSEIANAHRELTPNLAPRQLYLGLAAKRPDGTYVKAEWLGANAEHELRPAMFPTVSAARAALAGPKDKIYPRLPYPGDPISSRTYSPKAQAHREPVKAVLRQGCR